MSADDLRPPPESAHLRWHWLIPYGEKEPRPFERDGEAWVADNLYRARSSPQRLTDQHWRYHGPCDPAALTINPEDAGQMERVVEAAKIAIADYDDARQYSTRDSMEDLRAALKALADG